jgi:hypothetical protein
MPDELAGALERLSERTRDLRLTVIEDRPRGESLAVERFADSVEELAAAVGQRRRGLATAARVLFALASPEQLGQLEAVARQRNGEWRAWVAVVEREVEAAAGALLDALDAALR